MSISELRVSHDSFQKGAQKIYKQKVMIVGVGLGDPH
jgi:hypothetical protein